ncbi:MAG: peptidase M28 [Bacteroidetes bacterium HGW-Bacteroidetes-21]|jgi:hypothetical protein|nr:MAG: peptidase M28 [Bacteroidetes bacterium HGW-Bacteroidetes-21]
MKSFVCLLLIVFFSGYFAFSQDLDYAKQVVSKLASSDMKGRGYVENGEKIASDYIAAEFEKMGLKPVGTSYFQPFKLSVNTFPNSMVCIFNKDTLKAGIDYLVEACSPKIEGTFKVVILTRAEIAKQETLMAKLDKAKNSILYIDNREKEETDKGIKKKVDNLIEAIKYDPQVKVKAVIVQSNEKLTWDASTTVNSKPILSINKEMDPQNLKSISLNIVNEFKEKYETRNVIGFIEGNEKPDSFIVVTAHYDHLGLMGKDVCFFGANDNASGVAYILNLAKYYSVNKPKYSMVFIALAAEELGILGAKEYAENPTINLKKIKFLINFDLAGTGDEGIRVVNGSVYKNKFDLLTKLNTENNLLPKIDIRGEACISDHCMFYMKGVPCFYIYTQGGIKAYHDIYDKYETLPFTEFTDYVSLMIKFFDAL